MNIPATGSSGKPSHLPPFWRLTISLNDEPENLAVLPKIEASLQDKLLLFHVAERDMPMPTTTDIEREAFWETLLSKLPAVVYFLQNWSRSTDLRDSRFGSASYLNPYLLKELEFSSPEIALLDLIDQALFKSAREAWNGSATELEIILRKFDSRVAGKLLSYANATGTLLGHLKKVHPERVKYHRDSEKRDWEILPPSK